MAFSFIKASVAQTFAGTTVNATFGSAVSAGHAILVGIVASPSTVTISSISDGVNTYTIGSVSDASGGYRITYGYALNVAAGTPSVTVTLSGVTTGALISIEDWSGIATSAAADGGSAAFTAGSGTPGEAFSAGAFTPSSNGDLIWAFSFGPNGGGQNVGSGFAVAFNDVADGYLSEFQTQTTATSVNAGFTSITGGFAYYALAAAFKAASVTPTWGWEPQEPQGVCPPARSAASKSSRAGAVMRGDDGSQGLFRRWFNAGWESQPPQPPHPRRERFGALVGWEDGNESGFTFWRNSGWESTAIPPLRSKRTHAWLMGEPGNEATLFIAPQPWGWDLQPPDLKVFVSKRGGAGVDGLSQFASFNLAPWWESQDWVARIPAWRRRAFALDPNIPSVFVPPPAPAIWGWDPILLQTPRPPRQRAAGAMSGDDGVYGALTNFVAHGWPTQPWQPPHRRPERAGAIMRGNDGNDNVFSFITAPINPGWEVAPALAYHWRRERGAAVMRGDDGTHGTFAAWLNSGWEVQPPQPPHPRPERAAAWMPGEPAIQSTFAPWLNAGWETQPPQPPHPRREKAGAIMAGDPGNEAQFVFVPFTLPVIGWDVPFYPPRRFLRIPAFLQGDQGNHGPFQRWLNAGWEVQPVQPPHRRPEQKFAASARGDDGSAAPYVLFRPHGWPVQPWQPPHPRREKAASWMRGEDGNEGIFTFQPVSFAPYPWDVLLQPPYLRWGRGVMVMPVGLDVVFAPVLPITVSACTIYGRDEDRVTFFGRDCAC